MIKIDFLTRFSRDCFRLRRFFRTLLHICGRLVGLPGPNRREKRSTLSGRKSGNSSRTSTFAYFDGSIAANGVSNFRSFSRSLSRFASSPESLSDLFDSWLICVFSGMLGGGINALSSSDDFVVVSFVSVLLESLADGSTRTVVAGIAASISS